MSNRQTKTDNSFFAAKVQLRINHLPASPAIKVLDAFAGDGLIWDYIRKAAKRKIEVLRIEEKKGMKGIYLNGNNVKFIQSIPLEEFDVLDLDAYGCCFDLIDYILNYDRDRGIHHKVFITFIQSYTGALPYKMLEMLGYSRIMLEKIPTLFYRDGIEKFKNYLSLYGIEKIFIKSFGRKHYLFLET